MAATAESLQLKISRGVPVDSVLRMAERAGVPRSALRFPGDEFNAAEANARAAFAGDGGGCAASDGSWEALVHRSALFQEALGTAAPTVHNRLRAITDAPGRARAVELAKGARPVVLRSVLALMEEWLSVKRVHGSDIEQALYSPEGAGICTPALLINRLLHKRPVCLVGAHDQWLLPSGRGGAGGVEAVGTALEAGAPLTLAEALSYDELALSALVGMSCPTRFINSGDRGNQAVPGAPGSFEEEGVYVGLVGARFERPGFMEWSHMVITPEQNNAVPSDVTGGGTALAVRSAHERVSEERALLLAAWARFYGLACPDVDAAGTAAASSPPVFTFPSYAEAMADTTGRFYPISHSANLLDLRVYEARMRASAETLLREAQARAEEAGRPAYVHAVGLGLGVWQVAGPAQTECSLRAYRAALEAGPGDKAGRDGASEPWSHVGHLDFSWFGEAATNGVFTPGEVVNGVAVRFSRRDPAAPLCADVSVQGEHLLVASYAWDGGALPGNEYWWGQLAASGDPAAACCSWIGELGNPHINPSASASTLRAFGTPVPAADAVSADANL